MHVIVKPEHIANGRRDDIMDCPIALALKEQFSEYNWHVYFNTAFAYEGSPFLEYTKRLILPEIAVTFIQRFDQGIIPDPIEFDLEET